MLLSEGWTLTAAAEAAGVSVRCARKWVGRYRLQGEPGCSIVPRRRGGSRTARPPSGSRRSRAAPAALHRGRDRRDAGDGALDRLGDPDPARAGPAWPAGARASRSATSARGPASWSISTSRSSAGSRAAPANASAATPPAATARSRIDATASARTVGWEYVHIAVDDYSRLAYAEVLEDEKATTAVGFLRRAVAFYRRHGITVERVLTDNGGAYRSTIHALACRSLGIRHLRTRPYRPQTNGKAERFIRTLLNGWAYGAIYRISKNAPRP